MTQPVQADSSPDAVDSSMGISTELGRRDVGTQSDLLGAPGRPGREDNPLDHPFLAGDF